MGIIFRAPLQDVTMNRIRTHLPIHSTVAVSGGLEYFPLCRTM